ncbi:MAG: cytochrome c oxidase subunit II [Candidatus Binatus sp.]|uniref:cytochrome c oxidase subunit II n=1 Tax=Candidatus Binatus sp. TaxID=2811406 RepID=UPI0027244AB0|nr:cytochrome c oxidase subunit II [Candidatus Binatus sp.]MDO8432857.1 cytochrome c oxidase subunit II [Candidatus Binatus sp.]
MLEYLWFPHDISTFGPRVDFLFLLIFWIVMIVWIAVMVTMVIFMIRYRTKPGRKAEYIEGNSRLELVWTTVTAAILVMLAFMSRSTWADIKEHAPPGDVFYAVNAKQFNWEMTYPGPDGKLGTKDDLTLENEMHVPVHKVVRLDLTSKDVIHSFFVPNMRLKQDAVPGRVIPVWFEATETGQYEIPCAELCGFGHSGMKGNLTVQSEEDFNKWLQDQYAQSK